MYVGRFDAMRTKQKVALRNACRDISEAWADDWRAVAGDFARVLGDFDA